MFRFQMSHRQPTSPGPPHAATPSTLSTPTQLWNVSALHPFPAAKITRLIEFITKGVTVHFLQAEAVFAALHPVFEWIEENDIDEIFFVSDSPVSQYRNGKMVYLIRQYAMEKKKKIQWLYTESGHGNWF